jgi:membrane-associated phospholipid phosphatase
MLTQTQVSSVPEVESERERSTSVAPRLRRLTALAYVAAFVQQYRQNGFPFDRERVLLWIVGGLLVACIGRPWRRATQVVVDWFPFAVLLFVYDYTQSVAGQLGVPVLVRPVVAVERTLFGGTVPSVWLQQHLLDTASTHVAWWELAVSVVYASHFVVPLLLAAYLWWRSRQLWKQWLLRFMTLSAAACVTFAMLPTAPPWYASDEGVIGAVTRPAGRGWAKVNLFAAPDLLTWGRNHANPFAAVPSLHAGYALLLALFFYRVIGRGRWRALLLAYPMAMAFALVYAGEHYVVDVVLGWIYAGGTMAAAPRIERWWGERRRARLRP